MLVRAGTGVPEDVSVVGYDDSPLARLGTVDLTSVSQEPGALADATVAVIAALLDGPAAETEPSAPAARGAGDPRGDVVISPRLVVRSSTAPPHRPAPDDVSAPGRAQL